MVNCCGNLERSGADLVFVDAALETKGIFQARLSAYALANGQRPGAVRANIAAIQCKRNKILDFGHVRSWRLPTSALQSKEGKKSAQVVSGEVV